MANRQVEHFLESYRRLEAAATGILPRDGRDSRGGVIARLLRMPKFSPYREELDCCREVRNLLTHEVRVEGEPPIIPSDGMQKFIEKMISLIENPPRVQDRMTPLARLLTADGDTPVFTIMHRMSERDLSRVPLLHNNIICGMFGVETVFLATLHGIPLTDATLIDDLAPYLSLDASPSSLYQFVTPSTTLETAEDLFYHAYDRKRKIRALLVTRNGHADEELLGILSPYDLLGT